MKILVINCGSSSLKYQLIDMEHESVLAKGLCERIGIAGSKLTHQAAGKDKYVVEQDMPTHKTAIELVMEALKDPEHGVIKDTSEISAIGHRVLHGGTVYSDSIVVNDDVKRVIRECFELGPLHNPANLMGIEACEEAMPGTPNVAVFDTAFGMAMPEKAYTYAIPHEYYEKYGIRRYGFHGTSHKFVAQRGCELAGLDFNTAKVVTCHIGNGASIAAVDGGRSVDTSMGFTPVDGLLMGTRCGEVDPGALTYIAEKEHMSGNEIWGMINKQAGVLGITGLSSDMRDVESAAAEGNERARLALDVYYYRVKKYVGAYAAAMGGLDLVVFTGGVGENDPSLREYVCSNMEFLGLEFDPQINAGLRGKDTILTKPSSRVKAALITTNEELVIATDTFNIVENRK